MSRLTPLLVLLTVAGCDLLEPNQALRFWWRGFAEPGWSSRTPPDPRPDVVVAPYTDREPKVFRCVRGKPTPREAYFFGDTPSCDEIVASEPDSLMVLTDEFREIAKLIIPCAEHIRPDSDSGMFRECVAFDVSPRAGLLRLDVGNTHEAGRLAQIVAGPVRGQRPGGGRGQMLARLPPLAPKDRYSRAATTLVPVSVQ